MKVNRSTSADRSARPASSTVYIRASTKAATTVAVPSRWPQRSVRRPPSSSTAAPASGSAISSHDEASTPSAGRTSAIPRSPSVLQQVGVVDRGGPPGAVDRHDDREADDDLRGGDDHDEERHDLAVDGAGGAGEGDQRQVHRVEHQLHAHEHDDRVAAHEHAHGTDREEDRRENEVVGQRHRASPPGPSRGAGSSVPRAASGEPSCSRPVGRGISSGSSGSMAVARLSGERVPSGRIAGTATELARANTPGPGSVPGRSVRNRARESSFWLWRLPGSRSMCASTIAPTAAVISSALVTSKASRYLVNSSSAIAGMLPDSPCAASRPVTGMPRVARAIAAPTSAAKP